MFFATHSPTQTMDPVLGEEASPAVYGVDLEPFCTPCWLNFAIKSLKKAPRRRAHLAAMLVHLATHRGHMNLDVSSRNVVYLQVFAGIAT